MSANTTTTTTTTTSVYVPMMSAPSSSPSGVSPSRSRTMAYSMGDMDDGNTIMSSSTMTSASSVSTSVAVAMSGTTTRDSTSHVEKPSLTMVSDADVNMDVKRVVRTRGGSTGRRQRIVVANRFKHSMAAAGHGVKAISSPTCIVRRQGTTSVFRDPSLAPVRLLMTQSVRKSNDRGKLIPDVRPPLYCNDSGVTIFFAGNGLFPMFVDLVTRDGASFDMMTATPPSVKVFSYADSAPAKRAVEVDTHDWDMPSFKRLNSGLYVLKLGFKKAIGASRFFFLTVTLTSGGTTVKLTSPLFKVATKPRKLIVGNLSPTVTAADLRRRCPDLSASATSASNTSRRPAAGSDGKAKSNMTTITGPEKDERASTPGNPRVQYSLLFRTPSKCLAFFSKNYNQFNKWGTTFHLVPKRPLKMKPPSDLKHAAVTEVRFNSDEEAAAASATARAAAAARATNFGMAVDSRVPMPLHLPSHGTTRQPASVRKSISGGSMGSSGRGKGGKSTRRSSRKRRPSARVSGNHNSGSSISSTTSGTIITTPLPVAVTRSISVGLVRLPENRAADGSPILSPYGGEYVPGAPVLPVGPPGDSSPTTSAFMYGTPRPHGGAGVGAGAGSVGYRSDLESPTVSDATAPVDNSGNNSNSNSNNRQRSGRVQGVSGPLMQDMMIDGAVLPVTDTSSRLLVDLGIPTLERGFSASSIGTLDLDMEGVDTSWLDKPDGDAGAAPFGGMLDAIRADDGPGIGCESPLAFPTTVIRMPATKRRMTTMPEAAPEPARSRRRKRA